MIDKKAKILVIVPALNEERNICFVVQAIRQNYPDFKILVVNDGSRDETEKEALDAGASVVSLPCNLGIGGAVQTGFKVAALEDFDAAVQVDGDAQHDPGYLWHILQPVISGELDMCIGSRFLSESSLFKSTFVRRVGISVFSGLLQVLIKQKLTDPTSGFRAIGRRLIKVFAMSYPVDYPEPEAIKIARRLGARIGEVPVAMHERLDGKSSIRYFQTVYYMVKVTLAILIDALRVQKRRSV